MTKRSKLLKHINLTALSHARWKIAIELLKNGFYDLSVPEFNKRVDQYDQLLALRLRPPGRRKFLSLLPEGRVAIRVDEVIEETDCFCITTTNRTGKIEIWNIDSGVCEQTLSCHHYSHLERPQGHILKLPNGKMVYGETVRVDGMPILPAIFYQRQLSVFDASANEIHHMTVSKYERVSIVGMASLPNDRIACGLSDGTVEIWDIRRKGNKCERSFKAGSGPITALLALSNGGVITAANETIKIWSAEGKWLNTFKARSPVTDLMLSPQGLISVSDPSQEMEFWDIPITSSSKKRIRESFYNKRAENFYNMWSELLDQVQSEDLSDKNRENNLFNMCFFLVARRSLLEECIKHKNTQVLGLWKHIQTLFPKNPFKGQYGAQSSDEFFQMKLLQPVQEFEKQYAQSEAEKCTQREAQLNHQYNEFMGNFWYRYRLDYSRNAFFVVSRLPVNATLDEIIRHALKDRTVFGLSRTHRILRQEGWIDDWDKLTSKGEKNETFRKAYIKLCP